MRFPALDQGRLVRRYKRFLADVDTPDGTVTMHCPNTGAMTGCTEPGLVVWYSHSDNPQRKYPQTLEVVCTAHGRVGVNTGRANGLVAEALRRGRIAELAGYPDVRGEVTIPGERARMDFLLQGSSGRCWLEVKSLTLCDAEGRGAFPDAVSERAVRHVEALTERARQGDAAALLFCVQHTGVRYATAADEIDPGYGRALRVAARQGVTVLAYGCRIQRTRMEITGPLPVRL